MVCDKCGKTNYSAENFCIHCFKEIPKEEKKDELKNALGDNLTQDNLSTEKQKKAATPTSIFGTALLIIGITNIVMCVIAIFRLINMPASSSDGFAKLGEGLSGGIAILAVITAFIVALALIAVGKEYRRIGKAEFRLHANEEKSILKKADNFIYRIIYFIVIGLLIIGTSSLIPLWIFVWKVILKIN